MPGLEDILDKARKTIGLGEPNYIQDWYEAKTGVRWGGNWAWCDAAVSYWAYHSGNEKYVCPNGPRAYTVYHARDGEELGLWFEGTPDNVEQYALPGAIVFFDWGGTDSIPHIDHVGIVEKNLGDGRVQTIEGNTSNKCLRRVRSPGVIAGFFNPRYPDGKVTPAPKVRPKSKLRIPNGTPLLRRGKTGTRVHQLQECLNYTISAKLRTDGIYGHKTETAVRRFQSRNNLVSDGIYGPNTERAMHQQLTSGTKITTTPTPSPRLSVPDGIPYLLQGSTGRRVEQLQECLEAALGRRLAIDGIFGPATKSALVRFQSKYGLVMDGIYGPASERAMERAVSAL